jgi:DNA-binding CsgD family transcriptional regulator
MTGSSTPACRVPGAGGTGERERTTSAPPTTTLIDTDPFFVLREEVMDLEVVGVRVSKDDALEAIRAAYGKYGRVLSATEWRRLGLHPSVSTIQKRFGSWNAAWFAAVPDFVPNMTYDDKYILAVLRRRFKELRYIPSGREWRRRGWRPTVQAITNRFGSWDDAWRIALGIVADDELRKAKRRYKRLSLANKVFPNYPEHVLLRADLSPEERFIVSEAAKGKSYADIGAVLGVSRQAVEQRVDRILRVIEEFVEEEEDSRGDD